MTKGAYKHMDATNVRTHNARQEREKCRERERKRQEREKCREREREIERYR